MGKKKGKVTDGLNVFHAANNRQARHWQQRLGSLGYKAYSRRVIRHAEVADDEYTKDPHYYDIYTNAPRIPSR